LLCVVSVMQAKTHAARVQKFEEQISLVLQERQKVFEEAHREQMIKYMTTGQVDKCEHQSHPETSLVPSD